MHDNAASILGLALRITPLTLSGAAVVGGEVHVTRSFISFSHTPEYVDGDTVEDKAADGGLCASYTTPPSFKNASLALALCDPNPSLHASLVGGTLLQPEVPLVPAAPVGWASPLEGAQVDVPVALEIWTRAIVGGKPAVVNPFWHWVFPMATLKMSGSRTMENGRMGVEFEGWSVGNSAVASTLAAFTEAPWEYTTNSAFQFARCAETVSTFGVSTAPTSTQGAFSPSFDPTFN